MLNKQKIVIIVVLLILLAGNIALGVKVYFDLVEIEQARKAVEGQQLNTGIISFSQLFIEKVLKAENEVSFEDRLKLENAVRDLNNTEILTQWEKFTASKTEDEAQEEVKNLLEKLFKKISY